MADFVPPQTNIGGGACHGNFKVSGVTMYSLSAEAYILMLIFQQDFTIIYAFSFMHYSKSRLVIVRKDVQSQEQNSISTPPKYREALNHVLAPNNERSPLLICVPMKQ